MMSNYALLDKKKGLGKTKHKKCFELYNDEIIPKNVY